ncbi:MAG: Sugar kinase ribokinase family [Candidatus Methanohalarchaeum thermophilum]|uniref:Sugar kinase ribokinase family n=1 Tax=Methanohalarchaeum thermophilum TaxID=1903181 RepID=A0A1Q6DTC3_METT1|nr:MAG: Sugar kinase ribokinase family [Candidatus Methanohalarchaeum thermophilum]
MILTVGHTAIDHICKIPHFPSKNSSIYIKEYDKLFGGGAANVAAVLAAIGASSSLLSPIGEGFIESGYRTHLDKLGLDLDYLIETDEKMANAFVYTDEAGDQSTFFFWGASGKFEEMDPPESIEEFDLVHLAPSDPSFNLKVAEKGDYVSFDPGQDLPVYSSEDLENIIREVNILFTNQHELKKILGKLDIDKNELIDLLDILVVTCDEEGSTVYFDERTIEIDALDVELVDPTGAGDGYRAGFLYGLEKGYEPKVCGRLASTVASFIVEETGCQTNLPSWSEVKNRYKDNFGDK